jgi:hypothetical protein
MRTYQEIATASQPCVDTLLRRNTSATNHWLILENY